jgi:hypothetical protein
MGVVTGVIFSVLVWGITTLLTVAVAFSNM